MYSEFLVTYNDSHFKLATMSTFNSLLRKATSLLKIGDSSPPKVPLDGEITFCKNNVCVHPPMCQRTDVTHHPGYLTIREQMDEVLGSTLILTWIPNATLKKNSRTLENRTPGGSPCPTPTRSPFHGSMSAANLTYRGIEKLNEEAHNGSAQESTPNEEDGDHKSFSSTLSDMSSSPREEFGSLDSFSDPTTHALSTDVRTERGAQTASLNNGDLQSQSDSGIGPEEINAALEQMISGLNDCDVSKQSQDSVCTNVTNSESHETDEKASECNNSTQEITDCIQTPPQLESGTNDSVPNTPNINISSSSHAPSSSATPTTSNRDPESFPSSPDSTPPLSPREKMATFMFVEGTAESLAHAHNLSFPEEHSAVSRRESSWGVFSVDLSQMRSLRLFYSNKECNCGQLVIASRESQYKILHFHHGGLDKLAKVFEEYNFLSKSKNKVSESCPYRQFSVCRPELSASECHPEEGIYSTVDEQRWRSFTSHDGQIEDELQLRKVPCFPIHT
ncbi:hypothetical protein JTE90_021966 [Oedothorax gibbosus]|uniref:TBC1 domain family member 16 n=1 Tax=Oedothorax gibbosus TaxID=931172 RepID=A0AAV6V385_9ARAC|nr:hypothetical protein JTE90_021966 [Oedothorax gibbosus]